MENDNDFILIDDEDDNYYIPVQQTLKKTKANNMLGYNQEFYEQSIDELDCVEDGWLSDNTLNYMMHYYNIKAMLKFKKIKFLDPLTMSRRLSNIKGFSDEVNKYIETGNEDLRKYDYVVTVLNIFDHWILFVIDINKLEIRCYDSMKEELPDSFKKINLVLTRYKHLKIILPTKYQNVILNINKYMGPELQQKLGAIIGFFEMYKMKMSKIDSLEYTINDISSNCIDLKYEIGNSSKVEYTFGLYPYGEAQSNNMDCGVFCLSGMEMLCDKNLFRPDKIDNELVDDQRRRCIELLQNYNLFGFEQLEMECWYFTPMLIIHNYMKYTYLMTINDTKKLIVIINEKNEEWLEIYDKIVCYSKEVLNLNFEHEIHKMIDYVPLNNGHERLKKLKRKKRIKERFRYSKRRNNETRVRKNFLFKQNKYMYINLRQFNEQETFDEYSKEYEYGMNFIDNVILPEITYGRVTNVLSKQLKEIELIKIRNKIIEENRFNKQISIINGFRFDRNYDQTITDIKHHHFPNIKCTEQEIIEIYENNNKKELTIDKITPPWFIEVMCNFDNNFTLKNVLSIVRFKAYKDSESSYHNLYSRRSRNIRSVYFPGITYHNNISYL